MGAVKNHFHDELEHRRAVEDGEAPAFTPGPWMRDGISVTVERPAGEKRQCIAITHPHLDLSGGQSFARMKANASLIAAAPELYEALEAIEQARNTDTPRDWVRATKLTDRALAKARGEA